MSVDILEGLSMIWQWQTPVALLLGVVVGIVFGCIPGLTTSMSMAIFVPVTFFMEPLIGIPFLLGLYKGGIYGGSISAILIATPGTNAAIATVADGNALAKKGQAKKALNMALYASVIGESCGELVLILGVGLLARAALLFGAPEMTAILLFAFTIIASLSGKSLLKGLTAAGLGLFVSSIGNDPITGVQRFTFGSLNLSSGIGLVTMLIGTFALSEIFLQLEERFITSKSEAIGIKKEDDGKITKEEWRACGPAIGIGSLIGTFIGILPGIGQPVSSMLGYGAAKSISKHPEAFGTGTLEGVAGPEAANNATNGGAMVPLLSLGIPGDTNSAILLGAFVAQGLSPGPMLFQRSGPTVYAILWAMLLGNLIFLIVAKLLINPVSQVTKTPTNVLIPAILTMAFVGSYSINGNVFDIAVMGTFGVIGYFLKKGKFPLPPFVIAVVLGRQTEAAFSRSMLLSKGSLNIFFSSGISTVFTLLAIAIVLGTIAKKAIPYLKKLSASKETLRHHR